MEVAIIAGVVVLLFGVNKLPKLGGAIGESIRNFKKGVKDQTPPKISDGESQKVEQDGEESGKS